MDDDREDLASWWIRAIANTLDAAVLIATALPLLIVAFFVVLFEPVSFGEALITVAVWGFGLPIIGYIVWLFIAFGRAQTPGKQIVGIRAVNADTGKPFGWGKMFLREFVIKNLLLGITSCAIYAMFAIPLSVAYYIFGSVILVTPFLLNYLCPLWDAKNQTVHDKMLTSLIVRVSDP